MIHSHQPENVKECPGCGTWLISTARGCAVCGYRFTDADPVPIQRRLDSHNPRHQMLVTFNLPGLLALILLLLTINTLVILGLQKRGENKILTDAAEATATFVATTYVSVTPSPTETRTPAPPTDTPVADIEYVVVSGDSCISIATRFNIYVDSLLAKNDIDCALLQVGTVLRIPQPTATPEPSRTPEATTAP